jgi:hypothetical protein
VRTRAAVSNWVWAVLFLALTGLVVWGWAFDFAS